MHTININVAVYILEGAADGYFSKKKKSIIFLLYVSLKRLSLIIHITCCLVFVL